MRLLYRCNIAYRLAIYWARFKAKSFGSCQHWKLRAADGRLALLGWAGRRRYTVSVGGVLFTMTIDVGHQSMSVIDIYTHQLVYSARSTR